MSALRCADVAELADALDSGSSGHCARAGSSPVIRSNAENGGIERYRRFFYSIRNCVSYRAKTLRGIALRRKGRLSQATPPQAEYFVKRNTFFIWQRQAKEKQMAVQVYFCEIFLYNKFIMMKEE